ncbi:hypothetical protein [Oceanidesulfovibrio marinus]|uniref:Uncharacterized protein n=2 Tax=Oceanidesulfovibrio marinus TaxID=370038 RepID=A0ABX6NCG7_9BACT|nr:hypothetical protein [Oceanidesulfovibrio marinus]QJT07497.1 hypothetical protein E8L03_00555 [Oceanidesulfovibrio marinus]
MKSIRKKSLRFERTDAKRYPQAMKNRLPWLLAVLVAVTALVLALTAMRASAFEILEIPEDRHIVDELHPFPDISDWTLAEELDMGVMKDNSITMCKRKTFLKDDGNKRLYMVYFKDKPKYYWYVETEGGKTDDGITEMMGGQEKPVDPTSASDYRKQSKKNFDMNFGIMKF